MARFIDATFSLAGMLGAQPAVQAPSLPSGGGTSGGGTTPGAPSITFSIPNHTVGDAAFAITATSNSSGNISYSIVSGPATISGNNVTVTGAGTVVVQASQAAASPYTAATQTASFTVASASASASPTITNGLLVWNWLNTDQATALNNLAPSGAALTVKGTLSSGSFTGGGTVVDDQNGFVLPTTPQAGSETIYIVSRTGIANASSFRALPFGNLSGSYNDETSFILDSGFSAPTLKVGFAASVSVDVAINNGDGNTFANSPGTQAALAQWQLYVAKVDMSAMTVTFENLSQAGASWSNTVAIPGGTTRSTSTQHYELSGHGLSQSNVTQTTAFIGQYGRVTTGGEDTTNATKIKAYAATLGINLP